MEEYLAWKAPEHHFFMKSPRWYVIIVVAAVVAAVVAVIESNFMFLVFVILALVVVLFLANQRPKILNCAISNEGIALITDGLTKKEAEEGEFYPYNDIDSFAIHTNPSDPEYSEIILRKKEKLSPYNKILIADRSAEKAREVLSFYLPEFEYEEPFSDHLLKIIGL